MAVRPLTLVQAITDDCGIKKSAKVFQKKFAYNGTVIEHPDQGEIIQVQGVEHKNMPVPGREWIG